MNAGEEATMSFDEEIVACEENAQVKFVELLQNYQVELEKSKVPMAAPGLS